MIKTAIIKKLKNGKYRLYSRKKGKNGKRRNLGTYSSLKAAKKREKAVQYFKSHADDGETETKVDKIVSKLSDIAVYLEEAGMCGANEVRKAMDAIDGSFTDDEDYLVDSIMSSVPDAQMNYPGSGDYMMTGEPAGGMQGAFSIPEAEKVACLANHFDQLGLYKEADELDDILREFMDSKEMRKIIKKLEKKEEKKKHKRVKAPEKDKEGADVLVGANGHVGTGVTDNSNAGMFQGFSDAYFYSSYGNLEGAYGPQ